MDQQTGSRPGGATQIRDNFAGSGGGISNSGILFISGSWVNHNTANGQGNGGGILNLVGASCNVDGSSQINANTAIADGGGVWNQASFTMNYGSMNGNRAQTNGGGIFTTGENASAFFFKVGIIGNGATKGGGFYLDSGSLTLTQSSLMYNTASTGSGGAIKAGASFTDGGGNIILWNVIETIP